MLSVLGFCLGLWGARGLPLLSELPPGAAAALRLPASVQGVAAASVDEVRFLAQSFPPGTTLRIDDAAGGHTFQLVPQLTRTHLWLTWADGLLFLAVNFLVFAGRMGQDHARPFYWLTLVAGVSILIGGLYHPRPGLGPDELLALAWIACLTMLPFFFLQMSLNFPRRRAVLARRPWLLPLFGAAAAALTIWQGAAFLNYFGAPGPEAWKAAQTPRLLAQLLLVAGMAVGFLLLVQSYRLVELTSERRQLKWLLWGFAVGVAPYVFLRTLPQLVALRPPFGPAFDRVCEMTVPLTFTLAVARWRFLDIDLIIRRSLLYTLLAGALAAVYLLLAVLVGGRLRAWAPAIEPYVPFGAALAAAGLYAPTRRALGGWIDRTLFRIRHDRIRTLLDIEADLPGAAGRHDLAARLCRRLEAALEPQQCLVLDAGGELLAAAEDSGAAPAAAARTLTDPFRAFTGRLVAAPGTTSQPEFESDSYPGEMLSAGVVLAAAMRREGRPQGWLLLGAKRSHRRYVEQDLELVAGAAEAAGDALERLELMEKALEEEAARRRLDELDRLKSDFLSRVAHDLRTPVTSINWSADNLLDGVVGTLGSRQGEYVRAIKASAGQLERLVGNLLAISRLELGQPRLSLASLDLVRLTEECVLALWPTALARGVRLVEHLAVETPPVRGDREKLAEVLTNLLDNAVKYSPDGGLVELTIDMADDGGAPPRVRLAVRDHGPGLAEGEAELIFERFRQGRPSPYAAGTGFGLGLYIVKAYVELHGGVVAVRNHRDGGAEFVCELPVWCRGEDGA